MAFPAGWTRRAPIVIAAVSEALSSFPVHLDAACFPAEALDSASGNKALTDGADLRFSSDAAGTTELPFEVVRWVQDASAPNRRATVHVKVAALSTGATTTIYVWYGNASATMPAVTDANGRNAVWSSYAHVLHLGSTSAASNATGGTDWTFEGSPASTYDGPAGLMLDLDGTDDAVQGPVYNPDDHLLEILVRPDATTDQIVVSRSLTGGAATISELLWVTGAKPGLSVDTDGALNYTHSFNDTTNASTAAVELWQVRNRSTAGGQVVSKALPAAEQTHQGSASDGTYLYSIGGHQLSPESPIAANNRYDPATDTWASMAALPLARWGLAAVHLGGKIYCMGGATTLSTFSARNDIYDIATNTWSVGVDIPAAVQGDQGQTACTDGTYVYLNTSRELVRYDPVADTWATLPDAALLDPVNWGAMVVDGGYIYLFGRALVQRYSIAGNSWDSPTAWDTIPGGSAWARAIAPVGDGTVMVAFGRTGTGEQLSQLYRYTPSTKVWQQLNSFDMPTNATAHGVFGGKFYVYGAWVIGKSETYSLGHHACYNISTGLWETVPAIVEFARDGTWIGGRILTTAPYASAGRWYVGRQDGLTSLRSGAKVGELRISASARSKGWMRATRSTLVAASTFSAVGAAADAPVQFTGTVPTQNGTAGTAFSWTAPTLASYFVGGGALTYTVQTGTLPTGLSLNSSTGVISGTTSVQGTTALVIRATGDGTADTNSFNLTIDPPLIPLATSVTLTMTTDGTIPASSLTGLKWAFFDQVNPGSFVAPVAQGTTESTDGSGVLVLNITGSALNAGDIGWLVISNSDGTTTQSPAASAFCGPVVTA